MPTIGVGQEDGIMADREPNERPPVEDRAGAWRIWPYALAFAVMCFIYAGCKLAGLEWAAERPWGEVIFFLFVAAGILAAFIFRRRIARGIAAIRKKMGK